MPSTTEAIRAVIARSPACVAVHDREGWLALFADAAFIEDPVGSAPAAKVNGVLGRFYDTFIAPHDIRFEILRDYFLGNDVFRDVIIHTRVRPGVEVKVEAYLLYQLDDNNGELRVRRMAAHWTLAKMTKVAMGMGPRAWLAMTGLFVRMVRIMGLSWVGTYLASLWRGIGRRGPAALSELATAIAARNPAGVDALCVVRSDEPSAQGNLQVELGAHALTPIQLIDALPPECRLETDGLVAAGWTITFRFRLTGLSDGIGILEFDRRTRKIERARFFAS